MIFYGTMKTFVSLLGVFFVVCIMGTIFGFCTCLLYAHTTLLVAGQPVSSVPDGAPLFYLLASCAVAAAVSCVFLVNYTIRYPKNALVHALSFVFIGLVAWLAVIPCCVNYAGKAAAKIEEQERPLPSRRYFRPDGDGIFFYSAIFPETDSGNGLYIDLNGFTSSKSGVLRIEQAPINRNASAPFCDLLIRNTMKSPKIAKPFLSVFRQFALNAATALKNGWKSWLMFATFGLACMSLLGLRRIFRWRLLNCMGVFVGFCSIVALNALYLSGWNGTITSGIIIPSWLMNCIISCVSTCVGIVLAIFRTDPNREHD